MSSTPVDKVERLSKLLNVNLYIKRDDLYPVAGGGSKGRKINYILNENVISRHDAVVTAGSNNSNHLRATALKCAELGWKMIAVVHDEKLSEYTGNLRLVSLCGADIRFVEMNDVKDKMNQAMEELKCKGYTPYYIYGGGHNVDGTLAFYDATKELKYQISDIDYLFVASGTGGTQAGLEVGVRAYFPNCKVIGISVARPKERGTEIIKESIKDLCSYLKIENSVQEISFDDNYIGNRGYAHTYPEIQDIIREMGKHGIILDSTYTAKAMYALIDYIRKEKISKNSNVLFWHTGGLVNFLANK